MYNGFACSVVSDDVIFLCFSNDGIDHSSWQQFSGEPRKCRKANGPLGDFADVIDADHNHTATSISASNSKSDKKTKAEVVKIR